MNLKINDTVFEHFPVLESDRLLLRQFTSADADAFFALRSNQQVMEYMDTAAQKSEAEALDMIAFIRKSFEEASGLNWVIEEKTSGLFAGYFGFWRLMREHVRAEIGFALHPDFWGKGVMKEATGIALQYGFRELQLHSVEANVNPNNQKSIRLLEKLGFKKEAYFRENFFYNGKFYDSSIYTLLESDELRLHGI